MTWTNNDNQGGWGGSAAGGATGGGASIWAGFETLQVSPSRAPYIPAGFSGVLVVDELKVISSAKNRGRPVFVASFIEASGEGEGEGARYDWVAKADEESYMRAIKSLMCALNPAADPATFTAQVMERATSQEQPLRGRSVSVRAEEIITKSGNPFTKVHFYAVRGEG